MIHTIPLQAEEKESEIEYTAATAREVIETYYKELFDVMCKYDLEDSCDLVEWVTEETHFTYNDGQWESHTLDLISQGGE